MYRGCCYEWIEQEGGGEEEELKHITTGKRGSRRILEKFQVMSDARIILQKCVNSLFFGRRNCVCNKEKLESKNVSIHPPARMSETRRALTLTYDPPTSTCVRNTDARTTHTLTAAGMHSTSRQAPGQIAP